MRGRRTILSPTRCRVGPALLCQALSRGQVSVLGEIDCLKPCCGVVCSVITALGFVAGVAPVAKRATSMVHHASPI